MPRETSAPPFKRIEKGHAGTRSGCSEKTRILSLTNEVSILSKRQQPEDSIMAFREQGFDALYQDYQAKRQKLLEMGGSKAIETQHKEGKWTARERIDYF